MQKRTRAIIGSLIAAVSVAIAPVTASAAQYWQCVPVARILSGIQIFGNANTWWGQATGKYTTGSAPQAGSVLVFKPTGKMSDGHVAAVSTVITDRIIRVTHANWSQINGHRGQIEEDVTVVDVSPSGDWTQVKVWYDPINDLGTTVYPVYGFIYQNEDAMQKATAVDGVQLAANLVSRVLPPAASEVVGRASDRIAALIQQASQPTPPPAP